MVLHAVLGVSNKVFGSAGHNYQVSVQIDWWTGTDNVASFVTSYTQILSGRYLNPSSCSF